MTVSMRYWRPTSILAALAIGLAPSAQAQGMVGATGYETSPYEYTYGAPAKPAASSQSGTGMLILGLGLAAAAVAGLAGASGGEEDDGQSASPKKPTSPNKSTPTKPTPPKQPTPTDPTPPTKPAPSEPTLPKDPSDVPPISPNPKNPADPATPTRPTDPTPLDPTPVDPADQFRTSEFNRNYGLDLINAERRYAAGATGRGSLLAVYDTGAKLDHTDLAPNIDRSLSYNYLRPGESVSDIDGHGTHVASIMAGAKNDQGTHGVAFEARLMVLKGLSDGTQDPAAHNPLINFADAQRRAAAAGAIAINHSWSLTDRNGNTRFIDEFSSYSDLKSYYGNDLIASIEASARDGLVSVFATANDAHDNPSVNAGAALFLSDDVKRHTLAVTATDKDDRLASFANKCGVAREFCLAAPGVHIVGAGLDGGTITYSGTSNAAPHVSGAVGLLKSNFPELTGGEITAILLDTARDIGAPGTDDVFGRGVLDLENAVAPQGRITIHASDRITGQTYDLAQSGVAADGAIGKALKASFGARQIMVSDAYDRGYGMKLTSLVADDGAPAVSGARIASFAQGTDARSIDLDHGRRVQLGTTGNWADADALTSPYASLVDADRMTLIEEMGGVSMSLSGSRDDDGAAYAAAGIKLDAGQAALKVEVGSVVEKGQMLGAGVMGGMGHDMETRTNFASLGLDVSLTRNASLLVSGAFGRSDFDSKGVLQSGRDITTSSVGVGFAKTSLFSEDDRFTIGVSRNLSIRGGEIGLDMPVAMAASTGSQRSQSVIRDSAYIDMEEAVAPTDIQFGYSREAGPGRVALGGLWRPDQDGGSAAISAGYTFTF
jgi:subtilase-type serine protease